MAEELDAVMNRGRDGDEVHMYSSNITNDPLGLHIGLNISHTHMSHVQIYPSPRVSRRNLTPIHYNVQANIICTSNTFDQR